jgi:hypothetical protein
MRHEEQQAAARAAESCTELANTPETGVDDAAMAENL